jgi:hypothetical protein
MLDNSGNLRIWLIPLSHIEEIVGAHLGRVLRSRTSRRRSTFLGFLEMYGRTRKMFQA